jgi:ketosteroid isomerase-like protein
MSDIEIAETQKKLGLLLRAQEFYDNSHMEEKMANLTSQEARNLEIVKRGFDAFAAGDMATMKSLFAPDARWHGTRTGIFTGDYQGMRAILEYFGQSKQITAGTIHATPVVTSVTGNRVFALTHLTAERGTATLDANEVMIFTVENDVVADVAVFEGNYPEVVAFYS